MTSDKREEGANERTFLSTTSSAPLRKKQSMRLRSELPHRDDDFELQIEQFNYCRNSAYSTTIQVIFVQNDSFCEGENPCTYLFSVIIFFGHFFKYCNKGCNCAR